MSNAGHQPVLGRLRTPRKWAVAQRMSLLHHCFAPIADGRTRLLILGSLPGAASLSADRYYAHPRNQFWRLLETVLERSLVALPYDDRLSILAEAGIGLWDTVARAHRVGSLDADLRVEAVSDIASLTAKLPGLRAIAFNGATAARIGRRTLGVTPVTLVDLPSSSPAYTLPFTEKAIAWKALGPMLV